MDGALTLYMLIVAMQTVQAPQILHPSIILLNQDSHQEIEPGAFSFSRQCSMYVGAMHTILQTYTLSC